MVELVSLSEAARRLGRDFRTVKKMASHVKPVVQTRTGALYDLHELEKFNRPATRQQRANRMVALSKN